MSATFPEEEPETRSTPEDLAVKQWSPERLTINKPLSAAGSQSVARATDTSLANAISLKITVQPFKYDTSHVRNEQPTDHYLEATITLENGSLSTLGCDRDPATESLLRGEIGRSLSNPVNMSTIGRDIKEEGSFVKKLAPIQNNMSATSTSATPVTLRRVSKATSQAAGTTTRQLRLKVELWQPPDPPPRISCGSSDHREQIYARVFSLESGRPRLPSGWPYINIHRHVNSTVNRTWRKSRIWARSRLTRKSFHAQLKTELNALVKRTLLSHGFRAGTWSCQYSLEGVTAPTRRLNVLSDRETDHPNL